MLATLPGQLQPRRPHTAGVQHQMERGKADPARILSKRSQQTAREEKDGAGPFGQEPSSELLPPFGQNEITNENSREPRTSWRQKGVSFGVGAVKQGRL